MVDSCLSSNFDINCLNPFRETAFCGLTKDNGDERPRHHISSADAVKQS